MVVRCRALSLVVAAFVIFAAGVVPALGQDFDFMAVQRATIGLTNQGPVGAVCSNGVLSFSKSGTVGTLLSGTDFRCQDPESTFPISGGSLTFTSANRSVTGTLGNEFLVGHALPSGHALIAADTLGPDSPAPFGVGLTALVERHGATFAQSDLTGSWRVMGLMGQNGFTGGSAENYFATITFFANRSATGTLTVLGPVSLVRDIDSADITVSANGSITGVLTTVEDGDVFIDLTINGFMTPDKTVVVGTASDALEDRGHGLFFMQKDPGTTLYTAADLAGSWHVVSLQAVPGDSADGSWFTGGVSFNAVSGNTSIVTASNLVDSGGSTFPPVSDSTFFVHANGFIAGEALFADINSGIFTFGTLSKDKKHMIGVNVFGVGGAGGVSPDTVGLFSMVKLAPPPPASVVQFSTGNYSVQEGLTKKIDVTRSGATTTAVTVDYVATDPLVEGSLAIGTLTFAPGQTSRSFMVPTFNNFTNDPDRLITLALSNPTNGATLGARSTANLIVLNDDSTFAFTQGTFVVSEKAGKATITVTRSGALAFPASVPFMASAGTAIAGKDFVPVSDNLSFAKNVDTARFDVIVKDNNVLDGNRSVTLQLFPAVSGGRPAGITPAGPGLTTAQLIITDDDTPGVIKLSSATYSGDEGKLVTITILRAPAVAGQPLGGNVSVEYFTSNNNSAVGGVDYTVTAGTATFAGAQTTQTVSIPLTKDNVAEGPEHFLFNIGMPTNGATLGSPFQARVNINDIDKGGLVVLGQSTYSVSEGAGNLNVTVKRTGATPSNASVTFTTFNGKAIAGTDYGNASTTVSFTANETKTVVVPIFQNLLPDGDRTFTVVLGSPQGTALGTPNSAVVTIQDDESSIRFAQAAFDTKEGTPGKITVLRSGALGTPASVTYNISSLSAFPGVDFTGPVSGVLSFKPQDKQQFFMIPTVNNAKVDGNRSVLITLSNPTGGAQLAAPSTATFTIVDDDQAGRIQMGSATYTVAEGGSVTVDIMRLPAPGNGGPLGGNISVSFTTVNGNASAPSDFGAVSGSVTFGPLETKKSVTIQTNQNTLVDPNRRFFFALSAPTGGATLGALSTATIKIQDDDVGGMVFFSQAAYSVSEGAGNISITVLRSGGTANASVQFTTHSSTATSGDVAPLGRPARGEAGFNDFGFVSRTLFFGAGETKKTVVVPIFQDNAPEGDEVFFVVLSNPQGVTLSNPSNSSVTIVDDEVVIQFNGKFKDNQPVVVRTGSLLANVSVQYFATSGTAIQGDDFILPPGTLVFPPGVASRTIPIDTINDNIAEGTEFFTITLQNPSPPAQLGPFFQQVFGLLDNDFGGTVNFANTSPTASLGQSKPMVLTRAGGAGTVMTVHWHAIGGTGVAGIDFSPAAGQVTFQANQSSQTFFVNIGSGPATAGKTIVFGFTLPGEDTDPPSPAATQGAANRSTLTVLGGVTATGLELISQASNGTRGNGDSARPVTSADGRFVAFISAAGNLAPGAGPGAGVYVRDRESGTTELVSVGVTGPESGDASAVAISGDGNLVVFVSTSSNLVSGDGNGVADVFLRDRANGSTRRVSMPVTGGDADGASIDVAISADGSTIAFTSFAGNLAPGAAANVSNLYVFNRATGVTQIVGLETPPPPALSFAPIPGGQSPALSADGNFVAFVADNMQQGTQAYVFDRSMGTIELVSQNDGTPANGTIVAAPAISADGRFVAFESDATNLGSATVGHQIYVYDRMTGSVDLVSQPLGGPAGNGASIGPSFSADARFVAFVSAATNLVAGDTNGQPDVFVQDRATGLVRRVNVLPAGTQANGATDTAVLSAAGTFVAFATAATSLSGPDTNGAFDVLGVPVSIPSLPTADIAITNVVNVAAPALNASVMFTVTPRNLGPGLATSVQVTDLLPAGYALLAATPSQGVYAGGTGVWTVGTLANNASATLTLTATVLPGGPYVTVATRTASSPSDPNAANDSATASVTPQALTLTTDGPLVGVGRTINGVITIPSPAPSGFVVTLGASPGGVVSVPPIVAFVTGATTAPFVVTGVAVGNASITGSAAGLASGSVSVTTTNSVISLGALATLGPGQSLSLPISLSVAAPAGGVTVSFASANTSVATVTGSVFIPGGSQVPAANPQVTGVAVGSTGITASATGFAPDTRTANVVVNVTFSPSPFSVVVGTSKNITVTISAPAPAGGFTVSLATANSSIATVASPVTVLAGQTSVQAALTGVVIGATTLQAAATGVTSATVTVNVTVPPPISLASLTIGKDLQAQNSISLGAAAPAGGLPVTLTSGDATKMRVSPAQSMSGNGSIVVTVSAGQSFLNFYVQALDNAGTVSLTASAPGYQNGSTTITLAPSGFIVNNPASFSTTTLSANTSVQIAAYRLTPGTLTISTSQEVRAGVSIPVSVTATDQTGGPGVGTISSPLTFGAGDVVKFTSFDPAVAGTSLVQVVTPAGFNTSANFASITVTVNAPKLSISNLTLGKDLQVNTGLSLEAPAPPGGLDVTLASQDPSKVLLSPNQTTAGTDSITVSFTAGTSFKTFYTQALDNTGTATVQATAPQFQNGSYTVTLVPSGFIVNSPSNFTTTSLSGNTSIQIAVGRLTAGTLAFSTSQEVRAGLGTVSVDVTATDQTGGPGVGAITTSPLTFTTGDTIKVTTFDPMAGGTSLIHVVTPAGFNTSSNFTSILATVNAPRLFLSNQTIGKDLQQSTNVTLEAPAPPGGLMVTLTSSNASALLLSPNQTTAGSGSITLNIAAGGNFASFYSQALDKVGSPTIQATAPAYQNGTATVTLNPSGFYMSSPGDFSTSTFSANTSVFVTLARLNPGSLTISNSQEMRVGVGPVPVTITATDQTGGPGVGAITSPLVFNTGDTVKSTQFDPAAAGTSLVQLATPAGFSTPSSLQSFTATVTAPTISLGITNVLVGKDLQVLLGISLSAAPPSPVTVTVNVASSAVAVLSKVGTTAGSGTLTFTNVTGTFVGLMYVQGLVSSGTTTITTQAPGYTDNLTTVTAQPSGFILNTSSFTTTAGAANSFVQAAAVRLDPTTLNSSQSQEVRGGASIMVPVTAVDQTGGPNVGTITTNPLTFTGGTSTLNTQFDPMTAGTSQVTVGVPSGFDTPSNFRQITVTVNP